MKKRELRSTRQDNKNKNNKKREIFTKNWRWRWWRRRQRGRKRRRRKTVHRKILIFFLYNSVLIVKSVEKFNLIRFVPIEMSPATAIVLTNLRQSMQNNEHKYHAGMPPSTLPHHTHSLLLPIQTNNNNRMFHGKYEWEKRVEKMKKTKKKYDEEANSNANEKVQ